jgi:uncharacterized protein YjbI with pentapeptide repeats
VAARKKFTPDEPDLPDSADLDPAPGRFTSRARWDCVVASADLEVAAEVADAELRESVWRGVDLSGRRLTGFRARDVRFEQCDLSGAMLDGAALTRVVFEGCRMTGAVLSAATLQDVRISGSKADLINLRMAAARFLLADHTSLRDADFYGSTITQSALLDCDLGASDFDHCRMDEVDLHGSALNDVRAVLSLRGACIAPDQILSLAAALAAATGITFTQADAGRVSEAHRLGPADQRLA